MLLIKQKKSVVLSPQELVDCTYMKRGFSSGLVNYGCQGGWPVNAFEYVQNNGVFEEGYYQYQDRVIYLSYFYLKF